MTRFASLSAPLKLALAAAAVVATLLLWAGLTMGIALAGLHRLSPHPDPFKAPAWFWWYRADPQVDRWLKIGAMGAALALAGLAAARRRAFRGALPLRNAAALALVAAVTLALSGCSTRYGYTHHPPIATTGTPVGSYTLNIAASGNDGSAVTLHNFSLALDVQ